MSDDKDDLLAQAVENDANYEERVSKIKSQDIIDSKYGFNRYTAPAERNAWLVNIQPSEIVDEQTKMIVSAVDFYFIEESGERFKISYPFRPYFYLSTVNDSEYQVASYLTKKYNSFIIVEHVEKEDLDLKNHLSGLQKLYIKLSFPSTNELNRVRKDLMPIIRKNKDRVKKESQYVSFLARNMGGENNRQHENDILSDILDIREHDLPFHMRVAIDKKIFVGKWYSVRGLTAQRVPSISNHPTLIDPVDPVVLAFDIETTKLPLKFPDAQTDEIMMISYMIDGKGFLIINREIVSADIENFEYTPKEEYKGEFVVWNEPDEYSTIRKFFDHILEVQPNVIVTYNGDFFDWPFVETRARLRGINMEDEIGFAKDNQDEFKCRNCIHMDAFRWVKRDSYLPVGSQNLKAVAKAKLRYDPVEVDPEEMCRMAREDPQNLSNYSVSDAVATYYLYMKYVHPFVFALCTIIPLGPDDVLRKGSGTLCEALLMVEAFHNNIVFPNKYTGNEDTQMSRDGHRIESETYVGGHVEALEAGVFRADIPCRFRLAAPALENLRDEVPKTIEKELIREFGIPLENVVDFEERCAEVQEMFSDMINIPSRLEKPRIYHLDVGAMYPNIILTNRLQPCAMVDEETCMACVYNKPDAKCKRSMAWEWRGELTPATRGEYQQIMQQLEGETFGKPPKAFHQLPREERNVIEKKRIQDYSRRVYGKTHLTRLEMRETTICQRENAFYVDTVRNFRDRRYDYKELLKKSKAALDEIPKDDVGSIKAAQGRVVLYESLQLAHKCILNSFYGYVMRKGSRWFSMEMAGIVCHTGANIIREARKLVEQIGKPLELDTDGIWCLLPGSFPENITFKLQNHKKSSITVSYPAAMLNALVNLTFTNDQYHTLEQDGSYKISSENSIFFEVDGPYQCMVLPASKEEGKKLKKRYAVFNFDGSLAELKGFEVKRRGELNIIKHFQSSVFKAFLRGDTLAECYESVAREADYWLDVLFSRGVDLHEAELFDLISENRSMSRKLDDYGAQKSTSIRTAKRLAEFLGEDMVKDAGLACKFVISKHPIGSPVTDRAVPVAIFQADPKTTAHYLRLWTKQSNITPDNINIRDLLDWDYYVERLGSCVQKIITIPAALQGVANPVPRIAHPDWLDNKIKNRFDSIRQPRITDLFSKVAKPVNDINTNGKRTLPNSDGNQLDELADESNKENEPKRSKNVPSAKESEPEVIEKKTLAEHGFDEWLTFLKKKWKLQRKQRAARAAEKGSSAVDRMITSNRERIKERTWQILSIEENHRSPGYFNIWVSVDGQMNKYSLRVERTLYVNAKNPRTGKDTVRKTLPHRREAFYLYEYKTDEADFQKQLNQANAELCSAEIEGIYESQTPLLFRALVTLGCVCRPIMPPVSGTYSLDSLKMLSLATSQTDYLEQSQIRSVFLYKFSQDTRHIWCLVDSVSKEGLFYVVSRGELAIPNMDRIYTKMLEDKKTELELIRLSEIRDEIHFTSRIFGSSKDCDREIGRALRVYRESTTKPTLLVMVVDEEPHQMTKRVPNLSLFPHVKLHVNEPPNLLSQLDWQKVMASRVIKHYFHSFFYLDDYALWSRHLHIPIGNIPMDPAMMGIDLFFARQLSSAGHVLWASPTSRPDLGGKELDDLRLSVDWKPLDRDQSVLLNKPCFIPKACVELEIGAAAVTSLVQRGRLLEAEGADDNVTFDTTSVVAVDSVLGAKNTLSSYDEGASVDGAIKILKQLLADCVRQITHGASKQADEMAVSLNRWLHTSSNLLYDPAITRSIAVLEMKLVLLLAAEIERLGGKVLHATPTKVILCTNRDSCDAALDFSEMLIRSLGNNSLFAALSIRTVNCWDALLWKDSYNFTGIGEKKVNQIETDEEGNELEITTTQPITHTRWRIADNLPDDGGVKDEFAKIVSGYVLLFVQKQKEMEFDEESGALFRSDLIVKHIGHRLVRLINNLSTQKNGGMIAATTLVDRICVALKCDEGCDDAIDVLKETCKRLLEGQAPLKTPPTIFIANLFCGNCGQSSDVDIGDNVAWTCTGCEKAHNKGAVDNAVTERLNQMLTAYLLQDQCCDKCKGIRRDYLSKLCDCCGPYVNSISSEDLLSNAEAVMDIAENKGLIKAFELGEWISCSIG